MTTTFLRILHVPVDDKAAALLAAIREPDPAKRRMHRFEVELATFRVVPRSPFAYWVNEKVLKTFAAADPMHSNGRVVVSTNPLNDDFRYVRAWWEVDQRANPSWRPWAKGGAYSPFYYDIDTVIAWDEGRETYPGFLGTTNRPLERPASMQHFFRPGLTWPRRTNGLSLRVMARGSIFADKGPAVFVENDEPNELLALAAVTNSAAFRMLVSLQLARTELAQSYEVGLIQRTPVPSLTERNVHDLAALARRVWSLKRTLDTTAETSHAFVLPPGTPGYEATGRHQAEKGFNRSAIAAELLEIQREIDDRSCELYGISLADRAAFNCALEPNPSSSVDGSANSHDLDDPDDLPIAAPKHGLYSWLVGVAFGRFDSRLATGERKIPPDPEPLDRLPARSPGMWPEQDPRGEGSPAILADDPGHPEDICLQIVKALPCLDSPDPESLRPWLAREYFPIHIRMYSKSRRKAPIYWQLATPFASYSVWLYIHAFTKDTLYKVHNDFAAPKLAHEERKLESMHGDKAPYKELAAQHHFVEELRAFLDEVKRVAPLWSPNLDDGVIINAAPLWRLFPQHKPWQKECRECWDKLCEGEYDWAHLAMHLWPERVVPKCATDRSLAIAHDLEDVFWQEIDGKWKPKAKPTRDIDAIVRERTSPAVKTALQSLLGAPTQGATTTRARSKRKPKVGG